MRTIMKTAYIVVEGQENATALQHAFHAESGQDIEILGETYRSSAISMAGTLMSKRSRPVLLLVDAKSTKPDDIREETQTVEYLLLPAATAEPYKVISVTPSIAQHLQDPTPLLKQIHQFLTESIVPTPKCSP
jgi:hypothetical protein